jgi:hypothetical protein
MAAYYLTDNDCGREYHPCDSMSGYRCAEIVLECDYFMCNRCTSERSRFKTILDVRRELGFDDGSYIWLRDIGKEYPRYLVHPFGAILAIQEPECGYWYIRESFDDPDVNDGCVPQDGKFDTLIADASDPLDYESRPDS